MRHIAGSFRHRVCGSSTRVPSCRFLPARGLVILGSLGLLLALPSCTERSTRPPAGATTFASVDAGAGFTCAIMTDGAAFCWGDNKTGALGSGGTTHGPCLLAYLCGSTPTSVNGGLSFVAVTAGGGGACGLTADGTVYCWGLNSDGQIGNGSTIGSGFPIPVSGGRRFQAVSVGASHACGIVVGGALFCWGDNAYGQLGDSSTTNRSLPVPVAGGLTFNAVSAGSLFTCGVTTGAVAYCWGIDDHGQLGDSGMIGLPVCATYRCSTTPVAVAGAQAWASVSSGLAHACGLTTSATAYCWGENLGALGNGSTSASNAPVAVTGGLAFATISAGDMYSCAITTGGAPYCWGDNFEGRLGTGSTATTSIPTPVAPIGFAFLSISAGWYHTCGVAAGGRVYCWGGNDHGELGNSSTASSSVPSQVFAS